MRELKKSIEKKLPRSRLFLADLRSIYDVLKKNYEKVIIETSDYEISDFDQLKKIGSSEIHKLTFNCYDAENWSSKTRVYFTNSYANVRMDEDTTLNRGILAEIEQIIARRKRRIASILTNSAFTLCISWIIAGLIFWFLFTETFIYLVFAFMALLIAYYFYWFWSSDHDYTVIALYDKSERQSFWQRNKDRIIVGIIVGVIVAIITATLTYFVTMLTK